MRYLAAAALTTLMVSGGASPSLAAPDPLGLLADVATTNGFTFADYDRVLTFYNLSDVGAGGGTDNTADQYAVGVISQDPGEVTFYVVNDTTGNLSANIQEIFWDDGGGGTSTVASNNLARIVDLFDSDGAGGAVDYIKDGDPPPPGKTSPGNLTDHNNVSPSFETSETDDSTMSNKLYMSVDPRSLSGNTDGIDNSNEWLAVTFEIKTNLASVLVALDSGDLRMGFHVTGLPEGDSDSFLNNPPEDNHDVPEPGSLVLLAGGLAGLIEVRRRRRARRQLG